MARDSTPYVEQAVVSLLEATPGLLALVPAANIWGRQRPAGVAWPFVAYGQPVTGPFGAACVDGSSTSVAVHAYAETSGEGVATVNGSTRASEIVSAIVDALGGETGADIDLQALSLCPYPARAHITWTGSQCVQDGAEADAFHAWATFDILVLS